MASTRPGLGGQERAGRSGREGRGWMRGESEKERERENLYFLYLKPKKLYKCFPTYDVSFLEHCLFLMFKNVIFF